MDGPNKPTPRKVVTFSHTPVVNVQLVWPESTTLVSLQTTVNVELTMEDTTTSETRSCLLINADFGEKLELGLRYG